jgi:hypothetical protein
MSRAIEANLVSGIPAPTQTLASSDTLGDLPAEILLQIANSLELISHKAALAIASKKIYKKLGNQFLDFTEGGRYLGS